MRCKVSHPEVRLTNIDIAKGIGIILVVIGHCIPEMRLR